MRQIRTISIRLWLIVLAALPLSFWCLPLVTAWVPGLPVAAAVGGIFLLVGLVMGLGLDAVGIRRIRTLIREGELWEHAGIPARAEKRYEAAVRVYDSAWISPVTDRWCRVELRAALARFYLTSGSRHPGLEMAAASHLRANPEDETLALIWLERSADPERSDGLTQSVLTALADAHYAHPRIAPKLVRIFLALGRVDFSAEQLYRHALDAGPSWADDAVRSDILALMKDTQGERGGRPMVSGAGMPGRSPAGSQTGSKEGIGQAPIQRASRPYVTMTGRLTAGGFSQIPALAAASANAGAKACRTICALTVRSGRLIRKREKLNRAFKWGGMGILGIWLAFFGWSTFSHVLKSTEQPAQRIEVEIPKPFTIQVAAYLKQAHADRYVARLRKKGLAATVQKTEAGGKTWYLVRVSEFTDKKGAVDYGNRLKSEQVIEDFFVSNK